MLRSRADAFHAPVTRRNLSTLGLACGRRAAVSALVLLPLFTAAGATPRLRYADSVMRQQGHVLPAQAPAPDAVARLPRARPAPSPSEAPAAPESTEPESTAPAPEAAAPAASDVADNGAPAAPLPRPRPQLSAAEVARLLALQFHGFNPDFKLKAALDAILGGRYDEARERARKHRNPMARELIDWIVAQREDATLPAADILTLLRSHQDWPDPERLLLRAEQAFHALGPNGEAVLTFYSQVEPRTVGGRLAFAGALRDAGRMAEAAAVVRELWREWTLASNQAGAVMSRFGGMLTDEDHRYRFRRLVLLGHDAEALAQAAILGPGYDELARAALAVLNRSSGAGQLLRGVAPKFFSDPLYVLARARLLRQSGRPIESARFLLEAQPEKALGDNGDFWWDERRDLSRMLLDRDLPDLAYRVVAESRPEDEGDRVEAEFHAGWYALRYLHDSRLAEPHFRELHALATLPRTRARASYWLGRTHEAEGRSEIARRDYEEAARFGGAFYGQLAREKLHVATTGLERMPRPSAMDRIRFAGRDCVKAIRLLAAAGYGDMALPFFLTLGESVDTPGEVTLLMGLARRIGRPEAGTRAAALAEQRGLNVASLPVAFMGVPTGLTMPEPVDRALVYAVVRQESAFNYAAVSHAGARGLMQLMPATARATAQSADLPFSVQRLTTDPFYNATLGAHHLGELLSGLKRSYVLTFVGYNAGPGRALQWVKAYGDPRGGDVDPVDWIERIPFDETRDYVQKVMENLQVYRSRIGYPLSLSKDLVRGGPQG
jgi:soluble lytic murein transglycosylase